MNWKAAPVALVACLAFVSPAAAQFGGGGSGPLNLYGLNDYSETVYKTTAGRTTATAPAADAAGLGVILVGGQSQAANHGVSNYTPTNAANCLQINIYDGVVYRLVDPVLGATGSAGSYIGRLCDKLITAGKYTTVVMVPFAIGGTSIGQWSSTGPTTDGLRAAGWWSHRLVVAIKRAQQYGYTISGILFEQGTQDAAYGTTQAAWQAGFADLVTTARGAGHNGKWLLPRSTLVSGVGSNATIRAAQVAAADGSTVIAGPDLDTYTGANVQADGVHRTDAGNDNVATALSSSIASNF